MKLAAGFEVTHEIKFTDANAASQFFVRALTQEPTAELVSKFVSGNLVFAATATQGLFLTGLQYHAGKKVLDGLSAPANDDAKDAIDAASEAANSN